MLTGMMYLQVTKDFKCKKVMLDVETEEKCEFTRFWTTHSHYTDAQGNRRTKAHHHSERVEDKHDGFEFKSKLLDLKQYGKEFKEGNYAIQFQFKLPDPLPSSLKFKQPNDRAKPEAKVVHEIKVKLKGTDFEDSPDFKVEFKVRNDKALETGKKLDIKKTQELVNYFCYAKGEITMKADFEKEFFYKDDSPDCKIECDLSKGELPVTDIDYNVMQYTTLRVKKHKWHGRRLMVQSTYSGCEPGEVKKHNGEVDLKKIKKDIIPSCKVRAITNRHTQNITFNVDGCCVDPLKIEMPMIIAKSKPKKFKGFVPPAGMAPQPLGNWVLKVPDYKHMK